MALDHLASAESYRDRAALLRAYEVADSDEKRRIEGAVGKFVEARLNVMPALSDLKAHREILRELETFKGIRGVRRRSLSLRAVMALIFLLSGRGAPFTFGLLMIYAVAAATQNLAAGALGALAFLALLVRVRHRDRVVARTSPARIEKWTPMLDQASRHLSVYTVPQSRLRDVSQGGIHLRRRCLARPRSRKRHGARRAGGVRAGSDPPPRLARAPQARYTFAVLTPKQRGQA